MKKITLENIKNYNHNFLKKYEQEIMDNDIEIDILKCLKKYGQAFKVFCENNFITDYKDFENLYIGKFESIEEYFRYELKEVYEMPDFILDVINYEQLEINLQYDYKFIYDDDENCYYVFRQ